MSGKKGNSALMFSEPQMEHMLYDSRMQKKKKN
jgi:hypothetical protein